MTAGMLMAFLFAMKAALVLGFAAHQARVTDVKREG